MIGFYGLTLTRDDLIAKRARLTRSIRTLELLTEGDHNEYTADRIQLKKLNAIDLDIVKKLLAMSR